MDETVVKLKGHRAVLGFVTGPARGELLGIDLLMEQDSPAFVSWLSRYVQELGVRVVVSDEFATYKPAVVGLGVAHQVCLAHVRKNAARRLQEKAQIARLLKSLS